ncbi:MAG: YqeG family HAD IIIA-type phosphatase [bacterium]
MFEILTPDEYYQNIFDINLSRLKKEGIKGIICDIDNTIVPYKKKIINEKIKEWFVETRQKNLKVCLLSNGLNNRIKYFSKKMDLPAVESAGFKPGKKVYEKAVNILNLNKKEIVVIGDQIFTDVLGGNRTGLKTILVNPISKDEFIFTKMVRKIEKCIFERKY